MTMAFISTIRSLNYYPTLSALYTAILANLQAGGYSQIPQLTSTVPIGSSTPFPFSSPLQQLVQQQTLTVSLQAQIEQLQTQLAQVGSQAALVSALQSQVATLTPLQAQVQALRTQDDANVVLIANLKQQIAAFPALNDQTALVVSLQKQLSHLPGLQRQIEGLIGQIQSKKV
jgi:endonuclease/exonuclease/phosphatase (EEP) superfamily protein YafD